MLDIGLQFKLFPKFILIKLFTTLTLCLVIGSPMTGQSNCKKQSKLIKKAAQLIQKNKVEKAKNKLHKAIKKFPHCSQAYVKLAQIHESTNKTLAIELYDMASIYDPSNLDINQRKVQLILQLANESYRANELDKAGNYYDLAIIESVDKSVPQKKKIEFLENTIGQSLDKANIDHSLHQIRSLIDLYISANITIPCKWVVARSEIYLNKARASMDIENIDRTLALLNEVVLSTKECKKLKTLQKQAKAIRTSIWIDLAKVQLDAKQFDNALDLISKVLATTKNNQEITTLRNEILFEVSKQHLANKHYYKALYFVEELINSISSGGSKKNKSIYRHYDKVRLEFAQHLIKSEARSKIKLTEAINLLNDLSNSDDQSLLNKSKTIRKQAYIKLVKIAKDKGDLEDSLDYLNRLLIEFPNDKEVLKLKSEVAFNFGKKLHKKRKYDYALFYYNLAGKKDKTYKALSNFYIANLYKGNFELDTAKTILKTVVADKLVSKKIKYLSRKEIQRYNAIMDDADLVLNELLSHYCESDYDLLRKEIKADNSFYNLQEYPAFHRWLNGIRRIKVSGLSSKINFNPDSDETGDWLVWDGPDLLMEVSYNGRVQILTDYVKGDYTPYWSESAVFDYRLGDQLKFTLYDYDPHLFSKATKEYVGTLTTRAVCKTNYYELNNRSSQNIEINFRVSDSKSSPYTSINTIYFRKSNVQIGFELTLCVGKKYVSTVPFFFISIAEAALVDKTIDTTMEAVESAMVSTIKKVVKGKILPTQIKSALRAYGIVKCFHDAILKLDDIDWVAYNYYKNGDRKIP